MSWWGARVPDTNLVEKHLGRLCRALDHPVADPYHSHMSGIVGAPRQTLEDALAHVVVARPSLGGDALAKPLEELAALDRAVYEAVATTSTPVLDGQFRRLSKAADKSVLWLGIAGVIAVAGGGKGRRAAVESLIAIGATSATVNLAIKPLARDRKSTRLNSSHRL